jgi:organic radical activating enzyme
MFDLEKFYEQARSAEKIDIVEMIKYIKSFKHVILWGASFQGKAIGNKLINEGVVIENYWDIRSKELKQVNGIEVIEPFETADKENTIVIVCIGNRVILSRLINNLIVKGYKNVIQGDYLYMGMVCPFDKKTGINANRCAGAMECRQVYCERIGNIINAEELSKDPIHLTSITLLINSRCSLKCKFCTSYMNEYPQEKRVDIAYETISKDVDAFFGAIDSVGTITVMGGEPFMHPHISKIIEKLCEKDNFGLVSIATSGTYPITLEQLEGLHDKRVNISFSNYTESISENQRKMYYKNIDMVKKSGICYTEGVFSPEWIVPSTLYDLKLSEEERKNKKERCTHWHQLKNGKVHPCDFATAIYSLGIADYETDYVDLTEDIGTLEMKERLRKYINAPYYNSCGHHASSLSMTSKAAEQGYMDFKNPIK